MKPLNIVELEHKKGFISIEIFQGDLTNMGFHIDLLVVSAKRNSYYPTTGTLIKALKDNLSINIKELEKQQKINLKSALNCWVTNKHNSDHFNNILILEFDNSEKNKKFSIKQVFKNMFITISVLQQMGIEIKTIAMPALGTGWLKLNFETVITSLLEEIKIQIDQNTVLLNRLIFVEYSKEKASKLSHSLDKVLKRVDIKIPVDEIMTNVKKEILKIVKKNTSKEFNESETFMFLKNTFADKNSKSIVYGIACRRLIENLLTVKYFSNEADNQLSFFKKINLLKEKDVANWIISYLHVIRIFGNESAHDLSHSDRIPGNIEAKDISLLLFCVQRVLEFILIEKTANSTVSLYQ